MSDTNGSGPHTPAPKLPTGRPFAAGPDPRRNPGGRPQGLARLARDAVGEGGEDLVRFFSAVLRADRKYLGERRIALRDRIAAAAWLADRAFGKAVQVVEIPEDPQQERVREIRQQIAEMPPELREAIEAKVKSMLPPAKALYAKEDGAS